MTLFAIPESDSLILDKLRRLLILKLPHSLSDGKAENLAAARRASRRVEGIDGIVDVERSGGGGLARNVIVVGRVVGRVAVVRKMVELAGRLLLADGVGVCVTVLDAAAGEKMLVCCLSGRGVG